MKSKLLLLGVVALAFAACNDELNLVGSTIQPGTDQIIVYADTFSLTAKTFRVDSIYSKTTVGLLGNFYEPKFGSLKTDYMCQFYCPENFQFKETPIDNKIDSSEIKISYFSSLGDVVAPMNAQVFKLNADLPKNFYTSINPSKYYDKNSLLGEKLYAAVDESLPDSITDSKEYVPNVAIELPKSFGNDFYQMTLSNPEYFKDQKSFNEYFKGVYVTTNVGQGNILYVTETSLTFFYKFLCTEKTSAGKDTTYVKNGFEKFVVTPEVYQLNQFKNEGLGDLLKPNDSISYLKTPAGVFTEIEIPLKEMAEKVKGRNLSNLSFNLVALPPEEWEYSLTNIAPTNALLVEKDSMQNFFIEKQIENNTTTFLSSNYSKDKRGYNFGNISNLLRHAMKESEEKGTPVENITMALVPVTRAVEQNQYTQEYYTTAINNYLSPSAVELVTDKSSLKIELISSEYKK